MPVVEKDRGNDLKYFKSWWQREENVKEKIEKGKETSSRMDGKWGETLLYFPFIFITVCSVPFFIFLCYIMCHTGSYKNIVLRQNGKKPAHAGPENTRDVNNVYGWRLLVVMWQYTKNFHTYRGKVKIRRGSVLSLLLSMRYRGLIGLQNSVSGGHFSLLLDEVWIGSEESWGKHWRKISTSICSNFFMNSFQLCSLPSMFVLHIHSNEQIC